MRRRPPIISDALAASPGAPPRAHWITEQCAEHLRCSVDWLNAARGRGDGPPFYRLGRAVRYIPNAVEQWARERLVSSTSDTRP